jgi:hypothetical protein
MFYTTQTASSTGDTQATLLFPQKYTGKYETSVMQILPFSDSPLNSHSHMRSERRSNRKVLRQVSSLVPVVRRWSATTGGR